MIPPQVNGATTEEVFAAALNLWEEKEFPMIPPQVNGATLIPGQPVSAQQETFPMIPPQVNGATRVAIAYLRNVLTVVTSSQ